MTISSPLDISGLRAWYSPNYETTQYSDGAIVTTLHDLSGNGFHASVLGVDKPTLDYDGGPGGSPAIVFNPSSHTNGGYYALPSGMLNGATEGAMFAGLDPSTAVSGYTGLHWVNTSNNGNHHPYFSDIYETFLSTSRYSFSAPGGGTSFHTYGVVSKAGSGGSVVYWDGSSVLTPATTFQAASSTPYFGRSSTPVFFGSEIMYVGLLTCLLFFDRALTGTEMADLDAWLDANPGGGDGPPVDPEVEVHGTVPGFLSDFEIEGPNCPYYDAVQADNPWAFWIMSEPSGSTLHDVVNAHDMTVHLAGTGALDYNTDGGGDCFDGIGWSTSTSGNTAYAAAADGLTAGSCTVETWVRLRAYPSTGEKGVIFTFGFEGDSIPDKALWVDEDGTVYWTIYNAGTPWTEVASSITLDLDEWYHVVGFNGSGSQQIRINGVQVATGSSSSSYTGWAQVPLIHGGVRYFPNYEFRFPPAMDIGPTSVWASKLSTAQTDAHYAASETPDPEIEVDGTVPGFVGAINLQMGPEMFLAATMPGFVGGFQMLPGSDVTLAGTVPSFSGDFTTLVQIDMGLDARMPGFRGALELAFPPATDTTNRVGGRSRRGLGVASWTPPVVEPPAVIVDAAPVLDNRLVAQSFSAPTVDDATGQPAYTVTLKEEPRLRDRIVIGNKDVTFYRGVPTPFPGYTLVEPLLYGAVDITLPQVVAHFERPGRGALSWCKKGKTVEIQRVDPETNEVVYTDYVGFVAGYSSSGAALVLNVAGEAQGRAALVDRQVPIWTSFQDIGRYAYSAFKEMGLRLTPYLGPTTGIKMQRYGGMPMLDYISEFLNRSWNRQGNRWTIMPLEDGEHGVYHMLRKNTSTVHATAFPDDARVVADLHQDMAEEPNRIFMTGVTPAGQRVRFGVYPGLNQTEPAPYPFNNHSHDFGIGTTDADTDTGDGIRVMISRLIITKYLDQEDTPGGYDAQVARAIRALQVDAGMNFINGTMDWPTWKALFDLEVTGFSLRWSHIEPAAQRPKVRPWNFSATGAIMGRNPRYDPTVVKVDRTVDTGTGNTRDTMREWAEAELQEGSEDAWVGTIQFTTGALCQGNVAPGSTSWDLMDARNLRPGHNVMLPTYDGGTLVHVAAVNVDPDGSVSADVDTRARDAMEVWEIIERNRETRKSPSRSWISGNGNRAATETKDSIGIWDEVGGLLGDDLTVLANHWTVFPVVAGQEGTVRYLRIRTDPHVEFVTAVFGDTIYSSRLQWLIGNPLTKAGTKKWSVESVRDQLAEQNKILYVAGDYANPCGYYPKQKQGEDDAGNPGPAAPLTGRWEDEAGFSYHTGRNPVLWVALYTSADTVIPAGRVMWNQLEAGA